MGLENSLDEKDLTTDRKVGRKEKGSSKRRDTGEGEVGIQRTPNPYICSIVFLITCMSIKKIGSHLYIPETFNSSQNSVRGFLD